LLGTASVSISAPAVVDPATLRIGEDLPSGYRRAVQAPREEFHLVEDRPRRDASHVLHYAAARQMELKGKTLGAARGVVVDLTDSLAVHVDREGRVVSSHLHKSDRGHQQRIRDHVAKLVGRGRVYEAREGETVDPAELIGQKKPYYIAYDPSGAKRMRRAFIACGS
jgi:hypothetical protein